MTAISRNVSTILAYAGALPFWILMIAPETVAGINTAAAFLSYGAIIGSFIAGSLWGRVQSNRGDLVIIVASNVCALIAFLTNLLGLSLAALIVQLILFGILLVADFSLLAWCEEQRWYWKLRLRVTVVVAVPYCVMLVDRALAVGY